MPSIVYVLEDIFQPDKFPLASCRVVPDVAAVTSVQLHAREDFDDVIANAACPVREFFGFVSADRFAVRSSSPADLQTGQVPNSAFDLLCNHLTGFVAVIFWGCRRTF